MKVAINETYRRVPQVVVRDVAGERLLIPIHGKLADMRQVFTLNAVAARVWEWLDGGSTLAAIAKSVTEEFDTEEFQAQADVCELAENLLKSGLIEPAG